MARFFIFQLPTKDEAMLDTHKGLLLRPARYADAPALARTRSLSLREQGLLEDAALEEFEDVAAAELRARLARDEIAAWLAFDDGAVVGAACIVFWRRLPYPDTALHGELAGVYVDPRFRRRGLARELCRETIALARAHGVRRLSVHSTAAARALYVELGFKPSGQLRL
jgi:ribosomal protein S18 acetylase RimI-like enzyme